MPADTVLRDQHGSAVRLGELWAEGPALLVLVPAAFSTHCSAELGALAASVAAFDDAGVQVAALSCDPVPSLRAWSEAGDYPFPLLSDFWPHGAVSRALGAFDEELGVSCRLSVLVDSAGTTWWSLRHPHDRARTLQEHLGALEQLPRRG
ncbi:redoxin domain-containing protein [Kineococcus rubinsiae]|uniref:redoxin domain-containing protein n=1 Tax=Kineococcus rubinsiae TaxID=2609562 RepID=UPI001AD8FE83|nr:redoxin domain-containing protein [Kineococcus rubinsiae]